MSKYLVAYYSRRGENYAGGNLVDLPVGNTEAAAQTIQSLTGADTFRIDTVKEYPRDYHETTDAAKKELREQARPELKELPDTIDEYGVIFLGYPNWWGTYPMAVATFLEAFDFSGKTIVPFCTHEGSGMGSSERNLRAACPGATVLGGLAIRGSDVRHAGPSIENWIKEAEL